jgi:hypothetical protein
MQQKQLYNPVKILSFVVLLAMGASIIYAISISLKYWNGIGV